MTKITPKTYRAAQPKRTPAEEKQFAEKVSKAVASFNLANSSLTAERVRIMKNPDFKGWMRLCEILIHAKDDPIIASSIVPSALLDIFFELAGDSLTAANEREALKPLAKVLKSEDQSNNRKGKRVKLNESGDTMICILEHLAKREGETAANLWPALYGELDDLQLTPKETIDKLDARKSCYEYGDGKTIAFGQFANKISEIRKKSG